jgi:hypothetical protein
VFISQGTGKFRVIWLADRRIDTKVSSIPSRDGSDLARLVSCTPSEDEWFTRSRASVADGDPVRTEHIATALTAGRLVYDDGATQTFEPGGATTYVEHQRRSQGEWSVDGEGRFCSFWPPSYRACYELHWIVENRSVVGLRFIELDGGSVFVGRYR